MKTQTVLEFGELKIKDVAVCTVRSLHWLFFDDPQTGCFDDKG